MGHSVARQQNISEQVAQLMAVEGRGPVDAAREEARRIPSAHMKQLDAPAAALLQHETLTGEQISALL